LLTFFHRKGAENTDIQGVNAWTLFGALIIPEKCSQGHETCLFTGFFLEGMQQIQRIKGRQRIDVEVLQFFNDRVGLIAEQ